MNSLIFIPFLFWYFASDTLKRMEVRGINIGLAGKSLEGRPVPEFAKIPKEGWTYKPVNVKSNFGREEEQNFENLILKMGSDNIAKTGIRFQFSNQNSYGDFVKILNLMLKTKQEMYGVDLHEVDSFYVLNQRTFDQDEFIGCGTGAATIGVAEYEYREASFLTRVLKYPHQETYLLISGFLMLVIATSLKFKSK